LETTYNTELAVGAVQSMLGPILHMLYTTDLPTSIHTTTGTFADDTIILACHDDPVTASHKPQGHPDQLEAWLKKWQININATKSVQVTFTLRKEQCRAVHINNTIIPQSPTAKYLGLHLVSRLTWHMHTQKETKERKQIRPISKIHYWIIGRITHTSLESKVLLYRTIIKPIWTYGIELCGCASKSHSQKCSEASPKYCR
jgi:hypothetical protein